ncbi:MAG: threonine synthase [Phycisphaerales bacterium]|jgi:threonine synthase|nr:threonine synthase [Phycisphaerales bacterium]
MKYVSTRGRIEPLEFQDAVMMGLGDDGGLLVPQQIPNVADRLADWAKLPYPELAFEVISLFATDIPRDDLRDLINRSYVGTFDSDPEVAPITPAGDMFVMELWHGPTMSFKDVALQLLGNLFEYILAKRGGKLNIVAATSGDTGSAAICGVRGRKGVNIFVMHPAGRVSPIQERQMTSVLDANVHNIAIDGSFDDCQRIMKTLACDLEFKQTYSLGAVNSVNWARVLAQTVYYFQGAFKLQRLTGAATIRACVPTGNFGDILAGWYAMKMGAPISQLVLATNHNDILSRFFNSGVYSGGDVHHTLAPAMDIQVASNFERYLYHKVGDDPGRLSSLMQQFADTGSLQIDCESPGVVDSIFRAGSTVDDDILAAIRDCYNANEYLVDPHTACGLSVIGSGEFDRSVPTLCVSTAHPAKFPDAIEQATGQDLAHHPAIDALDDLPTRCEPIANDPQAVADFIVKTIQQ